MNGQNGPYNNPGPYGNVGTVNRPSFFPGRIINNINEVTPQDIPPDGSLAVFVTSDFSSVYTQRWTKDGTIDVKRYVPEQALQAVTTQQSAVSESFQNQILGYLESIEKKLNYRPYNPKYRKPQDKQERRDG